MASKSLKPGDKVTIYDPSLRKHISGCTIAKWERGTIYSYHPPGNHNVTYLTIRQHITREENDS